MGDLLLLVAELLNMVLTVYMWMVIARALISWVNPDPYNPIVRFLHKATDLTLRPVRNLIGVTGGFDFSPIVVIFAILIVKKFIVVSLIQMAYRLKGGAL